MFSQTTRRLFTLGLAFASSLLVACSPADAPSVAQSAHELGPWVPFNSAQAFGGQINGTVIRGLFYDAQATGSATGWWLRSSAVDHYAPISAMTFSGQAVTSLSTDLGWLVVGTEDGATTLNASAKGQDLYLSLGAPLNTTLRVRHQADGSSYGQYLTEWSAGTGGGWTTFCPHPYVYGDGVQGSLTEYMIPVGNALWQLDGSKSSPGQTIQLSCTHDSVGACATWGYVPWDESLASAHQACTRMKRGDFCGFGDPATTVNSSSFTHTQIQVWDSLGIHDPEGASESSVEAHWNEDGAVCFTQENYRSADTTAIQRMLTTIGIECPNIPACDKGSSGLLTSARPPHASGSGGSNSTH